MTLKILHGAYPTGYTLSAAYTNVLVDTYAHLYALGGANAAKDTGSPGGAGGVSLSLPNFATASNLGTIAGGAGGAGAYDSQGSYHDYGGNGGDGGNGVDLAQGGVMDNYGAINGGAAGNGGDGYYGGGGLGGVGGSGVVLRAAGTVVNGNLIEGGQGGTSGYIPTYLGSFGDYGGVGVAVIAGAGTVLNTGTILGGAGGFGKYMSAASGDGVDLHAGGRVSNGTKTVTTSLIAGNVGVRIVSGTAVVVNFGTIEGFGGASVVFGSSTDRLILESGSTLIGAANGDGGTLEVAGGSEAVTGIGATATMSGAIVGTFTNFDRYNIDAAASWTLGGADTLGAGKTLNNAGVLSLAPGTTLTVDGGAAVKTQGQLTNAGTIDLAGVSAVGDLHLTSTGATLSGGGMVTMTGAMARILGDTAATTLTNVDNTIAGIGFIGVNHLTLVNETDGVIDAKGAGGLVVATQSKVLTNGGLLEATGGGLLVIATTTVNNAGGTILAADGAHVDLENVAVRGGAVGSAGTGQVRINVAGGELDGGAGTVTLSGLIEVLNGSSEILNGAIANTGRLNTFAGSKTADLIVGAAGATLTGKGSVNLNNDTLNRVYGLAAGDTLTNVDNHIDGAGLLGDGVMTLVNQAGGAIIGNQTHALTIDTGVNTIVNAGLIENDGTGGTTVVSPLNNTGILLAATTGTLTIAGVITGAGRALINGGTLIVKQALAETVTFTGKGVLELGDSQGFTGEVKGLSTAGANLMDLADIGFITGVTKASYSGTASSGTLTVTDGTHTAKVKLAGDYLGTTFNVSSDGHGGTKVVDHVSAAVAQGFVAAMAGFGAGAAVTTDPPHDTAMAAPRLTPPALALPARACF